MATDILVNVANVNRSLKRSRDSGYLFQAALKSYNKRHCPGDAIYISRSIVYDMIKNEDFENARKQLASCARSNPYEVECWYDMAITLSQKCLSAHLKANFTMSEIQELIVDLKLACEIFRFCDENYKLLTSRRDVKDIKSNKSFCLDRLEKMKSILSKVERKVI